MRKRLFVILMCLVALCPAGCSPKASESNVPEEDTDMQTEENNMIEQSYEESREISFDGDIVISKGLILILTDDGHVWGKGANVNGNLGNGKRVDASDWVQVSGLENIVGIYASVTYGDGYGGEEQEHCYAVDEGGTLYRWGGNIFTPETVNLFSNIKSVNRAKGGASRMTIECENGEKYFMVDAFYEGQDDYFIPYASEGEIDTITEKFFLSDGNLKYFTLTSQYAGNQPTLAVSSKSLQDLYEEHPDRLFSIDNIKVKNADGNYFVDEENGAVYKYNESEKSVENLGGKGWKKYSSGVSTFALSEDGILSTKGDNSEGQLGDGTTEDLEDTYYKISETSFKEFVTTGRFIAALDYDDNLWAWGEGYGAAPEIVVSKEEFMKVK